MVLTSSCLNASSVQVSSISRDSSSGKWSLQYTPKKGPQAGEEQTLDDLDAVVLADVLLTQSGEVDRKHDAAEHSHALCTLKGVQLPERRACTSPQLRP